MRPPRILVVEDHPDIAVLIQVLLQRVGCEVLSAANGADALTLFAQRRPDAVVLDLNLPRLPGWEVCKAIKQQSDTPILVVTGQTPTEGAAQRLALGADAYFLKPFKVLELLGELQRQLQLSLAKRAHARQQQSAPAVAAPSRRSVSQRLATRKVSPGAPLAAPSQPASPSPAAAAPRPQAAPRPPVHAGGLIL